MKRKQHHHSSESQIITRIDTERDKANGLNARAEENESLGEACIKRSQKLIYEWEGRNGKNADEKMAEAARLKAEFFRLRNESVKLRKRARRIEECKLVQLGEALSEFRTVPIVPILGNDCSVASLA